MMSGVPILAARHVEKRYPGTVALAGVDFSVEPGQVHALIGENGAGKSTLVKILAGIEQPTAGQLFYRREQVRFASPRDARALGIDIIHQELQLFPDLSIEENLFVGRERRTRLGTIDHPAQRALATAALQRLSQSFSLDRPVGTLPLGQQQIVEIARAVAHDTRVLMMDEPTSALTASEIPILFTLIRDLASHGVAIVYISHRLEEVVAVADRVTVLRDGRVVGTAPKADVDVPWIVHRMTGRDDTSVSTPTPAVEGDPVLVIEGLRLPPRPGRSRLDNISFDVHAGEILGLYGLMGAGRTELMETVLGVHRDATGHVRLAERELGHLDVADRIGAGIAMVPEDRQVSGLVPSMTVRENMTLSRLSALATRGYLPPAREREAAEPWARALRVKAVGLDAPVTSLSGGNQQKVVIARAAMTQPKVLLLDDPTRGVDIGAKAEIVAAMQRLAARGMAIVFATSDIAEIQTLATRALVMARGCIVANLSGAAMTGRALASAASAPVTEQGHA
jgi:erythritol transport system ATP-binding protein